jgi:hypothetical protein
MFNTNTWNEVCSTWDTTCFNWAPCLAEAIEIIEGGARNPQEWGDHPYDLYDQQKELLDFQKKNPNKRQILVDIFIKCQNKKFKKTIEIPDKKIFINVKDVEFILNEMRNVGVDIKNIRKYKDDELQNLLG